ncbi:MAG: response regulator transcription factor [Roseburia sp.]|nr:response regulator transcription factor [Roseburia sp.]
MKKYIDVMIADDHIMMREGIKQLLEFDGNIKVTTEAGNGTECLEKLKVYHPDILLLDINMPEINGMEVLKKIKESKSDVRVLMLTVHNEVEYLIKALDIGVDGYIMKDSQSSELKRAIYMIIEGKKYIPPSMIPELNFRLANRDVEKDKIEFLTKREKEVLVQVANGMSNKEIAINLDISERTVKNHISNIFKKIDVSDRTQAAVFAIRNNVIKV